MSSPGVNVRTISVTGRTYAGVSFEEWTQLADAIDAGDLQRAEELLHSWHVSPWPPRRGTRGPKPLLGLL